MPLNVSDAYNTQFSQFVKFAENQTNATESKTIARLDQPGGTLAARTISAATDDKVYALRRSNDAKTANDVTRGLFKKAVADMFGGESRIPESVLKAMEMKDYDKGKPLTARRIMAVKTAIDAYNSYGSVDFFAKQANVDLATRLGYTPAERVKINRAANLFMAITPGVTQDQALVEVMTPGYKANRLMGYGGRFMDDAKTFAQGLKLLDDFATWYEDLRTKTDDTTGLTAANQSGHLGPSPTGFEQFVFDELATNHGINLSGTPEEVFGMKNNPATRFFGRGIHQSNSFTFLQMPQEKREIFYRCTDLLMPLVQSKEDNMVSSAVSLAIPRILRHFDELATLQAKGQLTLQTAWSTCFPDVRPPKASENPAAVIGAAARALSKRSEDYAAQKSGGPVVPGNDRGMSMFTTMLLSVQKGLTFEEACDFFERNEVPPSPDLEVPFSTDLDGILDPQSGLKELSGDLHRLSGYYRTDDSPTDDSTRPSLVPDARFTVNIPGANPIVFEPTTANDPAHASKMTNLSRLVAPLCGRAHPRQLNAIYFSMGQGTLMQLRAGFPAQGIGCDEHSPVTFTLSRDSNSGAVTIRYDSPSGCPITFNWTMTVDINGCATTTPIQVTNQPTP